MKRLVVLGTLGVLGIAASCGGDEERFRRDRRTPDAGEGGAPSEGGEGNEPGGEATGGLAGSGAGFAGVGGRGIGGRGIGGRGLGGAVGGAGSGIGGFAGIAGVAVGGFAGVGFGGVGGAGAGTGGVICGSYDCTRLPHVRPGAPVECRNGTCFIPPDSCEANYAHCVANASVGCETNLTTTLNCGACGERCPNHRPLCANEGNGYRCGNICNEPNPDYCGNACVDMDSSVSHCGACYASCLGGHAPAACMNRECVTTGACYAPYGDCDDHFFGCETVVNTPENCGACGRNNCGATNAMPDCSSLSGCTRPICNLGYGNCDGTSLDCESSYGAACFPHYLGTRRVAPEPRAIAVGSDGSFVVGGYFDVDQDFDASLGVDRLTPVGEIDAYLTRFDANGTYAWTRAVATGPTFEGVYLAEVAPDGSLIVVGDFFERADLDPGPAVDEHIAGPAGSTFVSKLSPAGTLTWARVLAGNIEEIDVAVDAAGAVYLVGGFGGEVDLDPGSGTDIHTVDDYTQVGFLLKLDASGNFVRSKLVEGESGYQRFTGVSIAPDASVWAAGSYEGPGPTTVDGRPVTGNAGMFVAAFESAGAYRGLWSAEAPAPTFGIGQTAAGAGAVHVTGYFQSELDMDFGAGVSSRFTTEYESGFVMSLDLNGAYRDSHLFPTMGYFMLTGTPNGGALASTATGELYGFYANGISSFSHKIGNDFSLVGLASNGAHFVVAGVENGTADYDPGQGVDAVYATTLLVTRYSF